MAKSKKSPVALPAKVYLVQSRNWQENEFDEDGNFYENGGPGEGTPVKLFADYAAAEAFARRKELEVRDGTNPFRFSAFGRPESGYPFRDNGFEGRLGSATSMDEPVLRDWLLDAGLTPPPPATRKKPVDWAGWWDENVDEMSDLQRAKVWEALDKVRFFEVVELEGPNA